MDNLMDDAISRVLIAAYYDSYYSDPFIHSRPYKPKDVEGKLLIKQIIKMKI